MQRASSPRPFTSAPDGKTTEVNRAVTGLWQASQKMTVPTGAALSTFQASLPSTPRKSRKPGVLWHLAHSTGISRGSASFQWVKDSEAASAWAEAAQTFRNGQTAASAGDGGFSSVGTGVGVGGAGVGVGVGVGWAQDASITAAATRRSAVSRVSH
jgi:F0F1-type ATP synthase membrane subunit c/vacuolar-type H+-ATPase subunit K